MKDIVKVPLPSTLALVALGILLCACGSRRDEGLTTQTKTDAATQTAERPSESPGAEVKPTLAPDAPAIDMSAASGLFRCQGNQHYVANGEGDYSIKLDNKNDDGKSEASLCVEQGSANARPPENCMHIIGPQWKGDWRVHIYAGNYLTIYSKEGQGKGPGEAVSNCADGTNTSILYWESQSEDGGKFTAKFVAKTF